MPLSKKASKAELRASLEAQAPDTPPARAVKPRSLKQANIGVGDNLEYYKAAQWFDEEGSAIPFLIYGAKLYTKGQYQDQVIFKLKDLESGEMSLLSLTANEPRLEYVKYFKMDTVPLGPLVFVQLDLGRAGQSAYYDIQDYEETEIPF